MKKYFFILIFLTAIFVLVTFTVAQEPCRTPAGRPCVLVEQAAVAQAQGLEFLGVNYSTNIGDVLASVYRFALGLVGIAALIMFVFGGVTYMTAADSQDRVKQGQAFMRNAVFGLVLALLSYLILYTINPDIVEQLNLDIKPVKEADVKIEQFLAEKSVATGGGEKIEGVYNIDNQGWNNIDQCKKFNGVLLPYQAKLVCITPQMTAKQKINDPFGEGEKPGGDVANCSKAGGTVIIMAGPNYTFCTVPFK